MMSYSYSHKVIGFVVSIKKLNLGLCISYFVLHTYSATGSELLGPIQYKYYCQLKKHVKYENHDLIKITNNSQHFNFKNVFKLGTNVLNLPIFAVRLLLFFKVIIYLMKLYSVNKEC